MNDSNLLYSGKAKSVFRTDNEKQLILEFRDDTSAFDGRKVKALDRKGVVNNYFNAFIMLYLENSGVPTHFEKLTDNNRSLVKFLDMVPVECVIRNIAAGSICRRLGVEEGIKLNPPTFEFFLKDDERHDPMINEYHIESFGWASKDEVAQMKKLSFAVNSALVSLFTGAGIILVDFKLEFGRFDGMLCLGDEFTPDGCRLWDAETNERLDKDRFRQDLGDVVESYQIAATRLGIELPTD